MRDNLRGNIRNDTGSVVTFGRYGDDRIGIGDVHNPYLYRVGAKAYTLHFTREGYSGGTFRIRKSMRSGILVLDILAGLVPVIVDAATGGWYDLSPDDASLSLERVSAAVDGPETIQVSVHKNETGAIEITSSEPVNVGVTRE